MKTAMMISLLVGALLATSVDAQITGDVNEEWVKQFASGLAPGYDVMTDMTIDSSDNVYVTGYSSKIGSGMDYLTVKYNSVGQEVWTARYNGEGNGDDFAYAISADAAGNVYVTGKAWSGTSYDYLTLKYDNNGAQQWLARYNGPGNGSDEPTALAIDGAGNVYVTGAAEWIGTSSDYTTIKYSSAGAQQWVSRYNGPNSTLDKPTAMALDDSGNVYVTGESAGFGTSSDYATIKYDSAGVQRWVARYNGPSNTFFERARAIAVDDSGNVAVTGESFGLASYDYATVMYNVAGVQQWVARYNGTSNSHDYATAIAIDGSGNVVVTGYSYSSGYTDFATIKYSSAGDSLWFARYSSSGSNHDEAKALVLDASGNIYVAGISANDFAVVKYNFSGAQQWAARYNTPGTLIDDARSLAIDSNGNIYVAGKTYSSSSAKNDDFLTVKYNSAGVAQWDARFNGPDNADQLAYAMTVDAFGNAYVTGASSGVTPIDYVTTKYNSTGNLLWSEYYNRSGNYADVPSSITPDGSGNVYITGKSSGYVITVKYNSAGVAQWAAPYPIDDAIAIAVDALGNVYLTGRNYNSVSSYDYFTIKHNPAGLVDWAVPYNGPGNGTDEAYAIAVDAAGNVYVTGKSYGGSTNFDYATVKYNSVGAQQWVVRYNGTGSSIDEARAIAVDTSGNVYVSGNGAGDYATVKYNSAGVEQWAVRYSGTSNSSDYATALALDGSGNVYVTGRSLDSFTDYDYATIKYNTAGTRQWVVRYNGTGNEGDEANDLKLDSFGNVYVTGKSKGVGSDYDFATVKYNASGVQQWVARYNNPSNGIDEPVGLGLDGSGNVYVSGTSKGFGWSMFTTIKYSQQLPVALDIADGSAAPGKTIKLPIRITDATGVAGAEIKLTYDRNILTALDAQTTSLTAGFTLEKNIKPGEIAIVLGRATSIARGSGDFVDVTFQVSSTATLGATTILAFQHLKLSNETPNVIPAIGVNGLFKVQGEQRLIITIQPGSAFVEKDGVQQFTATGRDSSGNTVPVNPTWRVDGNVGRVAPQSGAAVTFTADDFGAGFVIAEQGTKDTAHVEVGLLGDINKDRLVDVRDVILCMRLDVGLRPLQSHYEFWAANCDKQDSITSADSYCIILKALGRLLPKTNLLASGGDAELRIPSIAAAAGEIVTVPIFVEGRADVYAANFSLRYDPNLLSVLGGEAGSANSLLAENLNETGKIRLATINADGLLNTQNEILTLRIKAAKDIAGEIPFTLASVKLFDAQARPINVRGISTNVAEPKTLPKEFALFQNHPNPFSAKGHGTFGNPETRIRFQLPEESHVQLTLHNIGGQLVRTLLNRKMSAGAWTEKWDGRNEQGHAVPSGVYFYRLEVEHGQWSDTKKMILMR